MESANLISFCICGARFFAYEVVCDVFVRKFSFRVAVIWCLDGCGNILFILGH